VASIGCRQKGSRRKYLLEFEELRPDIERMFEESVLDFDKVPKELIREYNTSTEGKVKEVGPFVYGYSMTKGSNGKPKVKQFGNIRSLGGGA
jgi:HSP20 family protein